MSAVSFIIYANLNLVPYWKNNKIHNLGNTGPLGNLHAATAPLMTKFIDKTAYGGRNVRKEVYKTFEGDVLDMCCGTGFSTVSTYQPLFKRCVGIDTSHEMLRFARLFNPGSAYKWGNAETFGDDREFDTVSIMFSFHEMPPDAYRNVIRNAIRVARKKVVIVDISSDYKPSRSMLSGEPYLADYLKEFDYNIVNTIVWKEETNTDFPIFHLPKWKKTNLVKGHVDMWEYTKPPKYSITDNMETYAVDWDDSTGDQQYLYNNIFTDRHKQRQLLIKERHRNAPLDPDPGEAAVFIIDFTDSSALTLVDWDKIVAILFATSVGSFSVMFTLLLNFIYDKTPWVVVPVTWIPVVLWLIYFGHIA
jgi:SAM-dependent methyltransferase